MYYAVFFCIWLEQKEKACNLNKINVAMFAGVDPQKLQSNWILIVGPEMLIV